VNGLTFVLPEKIGILTQTCSQHTLKSVSFSRKLKDLTPKYRLDADNKRRLKSGSRSLRRGHFGFVVFFEIDGFGFLLAWVFCVFCFVVEGLIFISRGSKRKTRLSSLHIILTSDQRIIERVGQIPDKKKRETKRPDRAQQINFHNYY
jgi:hypothetical protein